jgi:hypothetical protein
LRGELASPNKSGNLLADFDTRDARTGLLYDSYKVASEYGVIAKCVAVEGLD